VDFCFYAPTSVTVCNRKKDFFFELAAPCIASRFSTERPRPTYVYEASKRKKWSEMQVLYQDASIGITHMDEHFPIEYALPSMYQPLDSNTACSSQRRHWWRHHLGFHSYWKYSAASAYKAQFLGTTLSNMKRVTRKIWVAPKVKLFACLGIQISLLMADRLEKRKWLNCRHHFAREHRNRSITYLCILGSPFYLWGFVKDWFGPLRS
jgi:hypothetical protein